MATTAVVAGILCPTARLLGCFGTGKHQTLLILLLQENLNDANIAKAAAEGAREDQGPFELTAG